MICFGGLTEIDYVQCFNHAIHLAVMESAFFFPTESEREILEQAKATFDENLDFSDDDGDDDDSSSDESEIDADIECDDLIEDDETDTDRGYFTTRFDHTVVLMRKIIRMFKKSGNKNHILQKIVKSKPETPHGLSLEKHSKTRWNSFVISATKFLKIVDSIQEALRHKKINRPYLWTYVNTSLLEELVYVFEPALIATEKLSSSSLTLLEAEAVVTFLIKHVSVSTSEVAVKFVESLKAKVDGRRNVTLTSLIAYLNNINTWKDENLSFKHATKSAVTHHGVKLLKRLFSDTDILSEDSVVETVDDQENESVEESSLYEELNKTIRKITKKPQQNDETQNFEKDFLNYERFKEKSPNLIMLLDALNTIPPTSTQSERNFSLSNTFVTKLRSRLKSEHLDVLCFLKSYFIEEEKTLKSKK